MRRRSSINLAISLISLGLLVCAAWLAFPTFPSYDGYYHLVWGRELLHGQLPDLAAYAAPTEHPLYLGIATLLALVGEEADRLLVLFTLLSFAALVIGAYQLGRAVFDRWVGILVGAGVVAALFVGTSITFLLYASKAYVDIPFLALVVWAAALEANRQRRGISVMTLLVLAGLLRPEAWALALIYLAWCFPHRGWGSRSALLVLALVGPLGWAAVDWGITGDPFFSLNSTSELAGELGRQRGIDRVPDALVSSLDTILQLPVVVLGVIGIALSWFQLGLRRIALPLVLLLVGVGAFVATGVADLSLIPRYLGLAAVALALFAAYALAGFRYLPSANIERKLWSVASALLVAAGIAAVIYHWPVNRIRDEVKFIGQSHVNLVALLESKPVKDGLRCGSLSFPNYRLVPDAIWTLDLPADRVIARSHQRSRQGVAIFAITNKALRRFGFADGASPTTNAPDRGYILRARSNYFAAYVSCS